MCAPREEGSQGGSGVLVSLLRGQTKSEAEGQVRWLGASQGVDMPFAISWALARPPQTLSQNLWGGPRSDSHPALTPTGASASAQGCPSIPECASRLPGVCVEESGDLIHS